MNSDSIEGLDVGTEPDGAGPGGDLGGELAVVTGAASGIGRATAQLLAARGATVAAADLDLAGVRATCETIVDDGGRASPFEVDVSDLDAVAAFGDAVRGSLGSPPLVVNCAGWDVIGPFADSDPTVWRRIIDVNYLGTVAVTHAFLDDLRGQDGHGRIVNVASDAGRVGSSGEAVYAGAKGAIIAFSKSIARELARDGVRVNCVSPGPTDTPLFRQLPDELQAALIRAIPLRRLAEPIEVAEMIAVLASPTARYLTGQVVSVSGGLTMAD